MGGKHLFDTKKDYALSRKHLLKYIELETNKNIANRAHSHQILGQLNMSNEHYNAAHFHFGEAIKLSSSNQQNNKNNAALPIWAQCQIHCGFADSIIDQLLSTKKSTNMINEFRTKRWNEATVNEDENDENKQSEIQKFAANIETAKKHYRLVLKLDNFFVAAPLGLARIFGQIEQKSKLCDKHYTESIKICKQKLIKLYEKYEFELKQQIKDQKEENMQKEKMNKELHQNRIAKHSNSINLNIERDEELKNDSQQIENEQEDMDEEEEEEIKLITSCDSNAATPTDKKKKIKFSDKFKITLKEIDNILSADQDFNISLIRIVKELRQYMLYCIDT